MPCYSRITSEVQFGEKTDITLLRRALEALEYTVEQTTGADGLPRLTINGTLPNGLYATGYFAKGTLEIRSATPVDMNVFKRAYSAEVVKSAGQRFGWTVQQKEANQFTVQRRF